MLANTTTARSAWFVCLLGCAGGNTESSPAPNVRTHSAEQGETSNPNDDGPDAPMQSARPDASLLGRTASTAPHAATPSSPNAALADAYPGRGFIVHEWGTNTVVVSSDGKLQRGMHHEEEDLPSFVYDRLKQADALQFPSLDKMETPVDYFYSERPLTATVTVGMPNGLLTQWYPAVAEFAPPVLMGGPGRVDPYLDPTVELMTQLCVEKYQTPRGGLLKWGTVEVLGRDAQVTASLPAAPLERFTWPYAREVAANAIRVNNPTHTALDTQGIPVPQKSLESERFLFYRGLGNFELPARVAEDVGGAVKLTNESPWSLEGPVFVLDVGKEQAGFTVTNARIARGAQLVVRAPSPSDAKPLDAFSDALEQAMTEALRATGLYRDEAVAMVRTWRRQWFGTRGLRVLYFAPPAWIDREVPITISPAPEVLLRVMVLRVEVLRLATEQEDLKFVAAFDSSDPSLAERHFLALGRFAEPRLRRALEIFGRPSVKGLEFLAAIEGGKTTSIAE